MLRYIHTILLILVALCVFTSCEETSDAEDTQYLNWEERNAAAFLNTLGEAKAAVAHAKELYGEAWEDHCDWRLYRTYTLSEEANARSTDTIAVRILQRGTGSGCPLYTDSVRVNFIGRYIPNELSEDFESRTKGEVFSYSGSSKDSVDVFSPQYSSPVMFLVSNTVEGFTTALMRMHIGDLWRVYIPQELGYGSSSGYTRAYSTLIYDVQLKAYYRKGTLSGN